MVGIPGRSRGCLTCRKRKKGCDQQRPVCGQCRRSSLVCQGYAPDITFVRYSPNRVGPSHLTAGMEDDYNSQRSLARTPSPVNLGDQAILRTAMDMYMFDEYWHSFFPKAKVEESRWIPKGDQISSWVPAAWILEMRNLCASDALIRTGLQANAYTMLVRKTNDKRLSVASMQAYSITLREVHRCLQDPAKTKSDSLLAACKFLALYESYQGEGTNWERHAIGTLRLLQVRGPSAHQTGLAHAIFLDVRYQAIVASIRRRQPTFLSTDEWCTVPFAIVGKNYRDEISDTLAVIPRLQYEYDHLITGILPENESIDRRIAYFELCRNLRQRISEWLERLRARFDVDRIALIEEGIPENFPLSNIMLAHVMTLYWASMMLVNVQELHGLRDIPVPTHNLTKDGGNCDRVPNLEITPYILYIAKSVPYFFQPDAGSISPQAFSFPLGVALNIAAYTNAQAAPEYRILLKAFSKGPMGEQIRKFLTSLQLLADPEGVRSG